MEIITAASGNSYIYEQRIGEIPPAFVRWGSVIIVAIFLVLLLVLCFVPYPHSKGESILQHFLLVIYTNYN